METTSTVRSCNCFAVRQAARHMTKLYERHLAEAGLTSAQFTILGALHESGPKTIVELAEFLVMDRTTLLRAMQPLQREDFLMTTPSPADPRQLLYSLAAPGERKLRQALPLWNKAQAEFEAEVGPDEAARLRRSLLALPRST